MIQKISKASKTEYRSDGVIIRRCRHPRLIRSSDTEETENLRWNTRLATQVHFAQIRYIEFMRSRAIRGLPLMWKTSGKAIGLTRYQQLRMDVMQRIMKL